MTIQVKGLAEIDPASYNSLHSLCQGAYLHGECYAFAIALHEGLGWPIVGLMRGDIVDHAGVRSPDGRLHDVRGFLDEETFAEEFPDTPRVFKEVSPKQLLAKRPVHGIERARQFAEMLWPELPWKEKFSDKVEAFARELEELSRKHGLWIRAPIPTTQPVICVEFGDEAGYVLGATFTAETYTIDRVLDPNL